MTSEVSTSILINDERAAFKWYAPPMTAHPTPNLIDTTPSSVDRWIKDRHRDRSRLIIHALGCYYIRNMVYAGDSGLIIDDALISSEDLTPFYTIDSVRKDKSFRDDNSTSFPLKTIKGTSLVVIGHGINVYGHALLELLSRLELSYLMEVRKDWDRILLPMNTPLWLKCILNQHYSIREDDIMYYNPLVENVELERAIIPTQIWKNEQFHPAASVIFESIKTRVLGKRVAKAARHVFMSRIEFSNPASVQRTLVNEPDLMNIASVEYGFEIVHPEKMSWADQIAMAEECKLMVGMFGSGLHNAVFGSESCLSIPFGMMNLVQTEIAALRYQSCSYVPISGEAGSLVGDQGIFRRLLDTVMKNAS